jgi:hypothetical protein
LQSVVALLGCLLFLLEVAKVTCCLNSAELSNRLTYIYRVRKGVNQAGMNRRFEPLLYREKMVSFVPSMT